MILRRCTLDAVGLASWENPSYIKCVSKNYENIQLLVRVTNKPYLNPRCFLRQSIIGNPLHLIVTPNTANNGKCERFKGTNLLLSSVVQRLHFQITDGAKHGRVR